MEELDRKTKNYTYLYKIDQKDIDIFDFILDIISYTNNLKHFAKRKEKSNVYLIFANEKEEKYFGRIISKLGLKIQKVNTKLLTDKNHSGNNTSPYPYNKNKSRKGLPSWL